jgi:LytS/YehU family sensor histidine kinase
MVLAGIAITLLLDAIVPFPKHLHPRSYDFLISILITVVVWEGNLRIDNILNERIPWLEHPGKRLLAHLPLGLVFSILAIYLPLFVYNIFVCQVPEPHMKSMMLSSIVIGMLITVIILSIEISTQFFKQWKQSLTEVEKYKTESVQAQLQNLKNQINPHFLFNNMSVLSSLVYKDQDKAVDFINQLSKVYRYLLDNHSNELVTLESELAFIKSYIYLLQIRFDKNIIFHMVILPDDHALLIPPMSLQMLIENAIKHNEVSSEQALVISIESDGKELMVSNNLQLRSNAEAGSKTGLQNIKARYKHFSSREIEVIKNAESFTVKIPLLNHQ